MKPVKYIDLGISEEEYEQEISPLIKDVFLRGDFIGGQAVADLEQNFAHYCGAEYAIAVNSGTDALILALETLGIGAGDEVITVSNSFIATANAIVKVGATPVFVDVGDDLLMDPTQIEKHISSRTKAIMPVHLMGHVCDMENILAIANEHHLKVIEDAAQSAGSRYNSKFTGTIGDIGCFSLHPLKNLSGVTDGGIIVTSDAGIAEHLRAMRNHGLVDRDNQKMIAGVSRLNTINAKVLNYRLSKLDSLIETRRTNAQHYEDGLCNITGIETIEVSEHVFHTYHTYIVKAKQRDKLMTFLQQQGVDCKIHYPKLIHEQPCYQHSVSNMSSLSNTIALNEAILTLPIGNVTKQEIEQICLLIYDFYQTAS